MKKLIFCLALCALVAIPATAMGAKTGDFEIGGYVKLHMWWDSSNSNKNNTAAIFRSNDFVFNNVNVGRNQNVTFGRFRAQASDTRLNFKIKGPEVFGAKTEGYVEFDFEVGEGARQTASNSYQPRLRHAWFRMTWDGGWQVLMGQYWGVFCNFFPQTVQAGPFQFHGMSTQRLAQIRVSKKHGPWLLSAFVGTPYNPDNAAATGDNPLAGANQTAYFPALVGTPASQGWDSSCPQFGFQVEYEQDLYGKAAFYGAPRGFVANASFGFQRTYYYSGDLSATAGMVTWGQNNYAAVLANDNNFAESANLTPWCFQATLFIPVLTTSTPDLKNTASLTLQFYVGEGLSAFGMGRDQDNSYFRFSNAVFDNRAPGGDYFLYKRKLMPAYGGYAQAQYYFNNAWFLCYAWGFQKAYGVTQDRNQALINFAGNPLGYEYASNQDQVRFWQEHNIALFFRPIKAFEFGLGYAFSQTDYFQITTVGSKQTRTGENHRIQFAGYFYF